MFEIMQLPPYYAILPLALCCTYYVTVNVKISPPSWLADPEEFGKWTGKMLYFMKKLDVMATNDESGGSSPIPDGPNFKDQFKLFAKFGDCKSTGDAITLSNSDKWMKQAKVIEVKKITTTDTGIVYKQLAKNKRALTPKEYDQFLETLAKNKKIEVADLKQKMTSCGPPATSKTTPIAATGAVSRLTDHTKYTGSHKHRFDETGKGRGKEGRVDLPNQSGYVQGYKDQGSYDTGH